MGPIKNNMKTISINSLFDVYEFSYLRNVIMRLNKEANLCHP